MAPLGSNVTASRSIQDSKDEDKEKEGLGRFRDVAEAVLYDGL